jgi:peroxiredoxin
VVAASEEQEEAGSQAYHSDHMGAIFKEGFSFSGYERDLVSLNLGDGKYLDISGVSGIDSISDGRGAVFADLDNDGDLDILLTTAQGEAHYLFRNNIGSANNALRITLVGPPAGRDAFGTVVRVKSSAGIQTKLKTGGGGFLSHHDTRLLFGLGKDEAAEWVEIVWPDGSTQRFAGVPAGSSMLIEQGAEHYATIAERRIDLVDPLPEDELFTAGLGFRRGERFPDLALRSTGGETTSLLAALKPGRRTLLNVWATWCVPCAEEIPQLQRLYPELSSAGIDLLGVSVDLDTADNVPGYIAERGVTYPIYTTDEAALETLYPRGQATVPLTLLLDGDGRVLEIHSGWNDSSEKALRELIEKGDIPI